MFCINCLKENRVNRCGVKLAVYLFVSFPLVEIAYLIINVLWIKI